MSIRRKSRAAWNCSHLNREAQGSVKQKCGEDQEHFQIHSPVLTDHPCLSLSLPLPGALPLDIPVEPALPGLKKSSPANGDPGRKQASFAASRVNLASGYLLVLHYCCQGGLQHPLSSYCHSHCSLDKDQPHACAAMHFLCFVEELSLSVQFNWYHLGSPGQLSGVILEISDGG